jgi:EAL and modified HD-GYP domain-containing signal transduction protein
MSTPGKAPFSAKASPCLARQPILTKDEKVFGYELLFRESPEDRHFASNAESATCSTIDTLNVMGLDVVCDGRFGFINCSHQMLLKEYILLLPPDKVVVEIQETVPADDSTVGACQRLKQKGYRIALDNFGSNDPRKALVPHVDILKVDIRRFTQEESAAIVKAHVSDKCSLLAQKVESRLQFITAAKDGFSLFQGYFFRHPERMRARHIPGNHAGQLRLLKAISAPVPDLAAIEDLIKHDASLCYRLLRYLNSPLLGVSCPVQSVRHAMNLLGEQELIRWIRMATTLMMGQDKCSDLILSSLVRARFCELIAPKVNHGQTDLFLLGLFSLMDAILEVPMGVVVEGLAFDPETKEELLAARMGRDTPLAPIYHLMVAREEGDWEEVAAQAKKLNLALTFVNRAFSEAMAWANQMTSATPSPKP